jgi:hypothetical protein
MVSVMVRTFLKVYMEIGSYFLFLQEQIKDIIIIIGCAVLRRGTRHGVLCYFLRVFTGDAVTLARTAETS